MKEYLLKPITETAAQAREAKGQKGRIAKQIVLGIDAHLNGYPGVPQDRCWGPATGAELQFGEAYALWLQAAGVGRKGLRGPRSRPLGYGLYRELRELG